MRRIYRGWPLLVLCLTALSLVQVTCQAATYYVAPNGNDGNPGTEALPWKHIDIADSRGNVLLPGDTVVVKEGTYDVSKADPFYNSQTGVALTKSSGEPGNPITYVAQGSVTINRGDNSLSSGDIAFYMKSVHDIVLDDFNIQGGTRALQGDACTNIEVKNCYMFGQHVGGWEPVALFQTDGVNGGGGLYFHNNLINGKRTNTDTGMGLAMEYQHLATNRIHNNTFIQTRIRGFQAYYCGTTEFRNNIIYQCWADAIWAWGHTFKNSHNVLFQIGSAYGGEAMQGPGEMIADPLFVNEAGGDYHLQSGSPAKDAGTYVGIPFNDAWPDMGAFETSGPPAGSLGTVTGKVTDHSTGLPVAGAMIAIGANANAFTYTDDNGDYSLQAVHGDYNVKASKDAYRPASGTVTIGSSPSTLNFQLIPMIIASDYYVSPDGDDYMDGTTPATAWKSINNGDAYGILKAGDIIHVQAGYYELPGTAIFTKCSGTDTSPITYKGEGDVVIHKEGSGVVLKFQDIHDTVIDDLDVTGGNTELWIQRCKNFEVKNCSFTGGHNGGWDSAVCFTGNEESQFMKFHNNVVEVNISGGLAFAMDYTDGTSSIYNNVFHHTRIRGMSLYYCPRTGQPGSVELKNNIFNDVTDGAICMWNCTLNNSHNLINTNDFGWAYEGQTVAGTGDIVDQDPTFVDQPAGDYRLLAGSPAIDAGTDVVLPYQGSAPDMGAFETLGISGPTGTVMGTITDAGTGEVLADALVSHVAGGAYLITKSDYFGGYTLIVPAGASQTIQAEKAHYVTQTKTADVPSGGSVTKDFALVFDAYVSDKISNIKAKPDNTAVKLTTAVVTAPFAYGMAYVEEESRATGIGVFLPAGVTVDEGDRIALQGVMETHHGERFLNASYVWPIDSTTPLGPLGMTNKAVRGAGAPNTGLLVKVWGKVTFKADDGYYFCVDDGSGRTDGQGHAGIPVVTAAAASPVTLPALDAYVTVTGVSCTNGDFLDGCIFVRGSSDIQ